MKNKINLFIAGSLLVLIVLGCNVHTDENGFSIGATTANLADLKFGRDKDANPALTTFNPNDKIHIVSKVSNSGAKHKIQFYLLYDEVRGQQPGTQALENELELEGDRSFNFNFSSKSGIDAGRYKVQVVLFDKDGKLEIDRKTGTFMVTNEGK